MARLTIDGLTKRFGSVTAVDAIDIEVRDGELVCILGPSGCGKSTALRMIAGFEHPTAGDIRIDGASIVAIPPNKRPTAMVFQNYTLWPHMTVYENVAFGLRLHGTDKQTVRRTVGEGLALVGLAGYEHRYPVQLSGGQQQRVALARAIVLEPKILLLDEPFSSLDALLRVRLREELKLIQHRLGITTLFVTHDQEEALALSDRIAVMNDGRIEQLADPTTVYARPRSLFVADFIGDMNLFDAITGEKGIRLGSSVLPGPEGMVTDSKVTVAVRPEELVPAPSNTPREETWELAVEQAMDLGHYRKLLGELPGVGPVKVYLSKSADHEVGERRLRVTPTRYLLYLDGAAPVEVVNRRPATGR